MPHCPNFPQDIFKRESHVCESHFNIKSAITYFNSCRAWKKNIYNFSSRVLSLHFPTDALPLHCKWCVGLFLKFSRLPSTHPPPYPLPDFAEFTLKGDLCCLHRNLPSVSFSVKSKQKAFIHIRFSPHPLYRPPFAILPVFAGMSLCAWALARCAFVPKSNFTWSYYLYIHTWHSVCNGPMPPLPANDGPCMILRQNHAFTMSPIHGCWPGSWGGRK